MHQFSARQNVRSYKKLNTESIKMHLKSFTKIEIDDTAESQRYTCF